MKSFRRAASRLLFYAVIFAIAGCLAGCALWPKKSTPTPAPLIIPTESGAQTPSGAGGPQAESQDHCDQLAHATPGIEELRMNRDGTIDSRQWTLIAGDSTARWAVVRAKNQPPGGWMPKPGIAKLNFQPPLQPALATGFNQFLAYAPIHDGNNEDRQKMETLNAVFGGAQGKFEWRGKAYAYALLKELPCYPPLQ